jgi:predicted ester cyclase
MALRRALPDLRAIVEDEIAEGDAVVQRLTLSGTHEGSLCGVPPSGRRATWPLVVILRLGPDGRFAEHWSSWDLLDLLRQLGAVPAGAAETPFSNRAESPGARCPVSASENA